MPWHSGVCGALLPVGWITIISKQNTTFYSHNMLHPNKEILQLVHGPEMGQLLKMENGDQHCLSSPLSSSPHQDFFASCLIGYKSQEIISMWCWSSCMQFSAPTFRTEHLRAQTVRGCKEKLVRNGWKSCCVYSGEA